MPGGYGASGPYGANGSFGGVSSLPATGESIYKYGQLEYGDSRSTGGAVLRTYTQVFIDALISVSDLINPGEYGTRGYGGNVVVPFTINTGFAYTTIDAIVYNPDITPISLLVGKLRQQISAPQFIRSRARHMGPRESTQINLEISQLLFDLRVLYEKYDDLARALNTNVSNIQDGVEFSDLIYHRVPPPSAPLVMGDRIVISVPGHDKAYKGPVPTLEDSIPGTEDLAIKLEKLRERVIHIENETGTSVPISALQRIVVEGDIIVIPE